MEAKNFWRKAEIYKPVVFAALTKYLPTVGPAGYAAMVSDYSQRQGKYFRPTLLLLMTELCGASWRTAILPAVAMQLSEDWLLIHDDVEDHSGERRSTAQEKKFTLNKLHGDELAINAGDALHLVMWRAAFDAANAMKTTTGRKFLQTLNEILLITTQGQHLELSWIRKKRLKLPAWEYYSMIDKKAGLYTVIGPLQLGALAAEVKNPACLETLAYWGKPFGRAFQIYDDVMNIAVSGVKQGKERGGDILEGKRTLILLHLLNRCGKGEAKKIEEIYAKVREDKTEEEKNWIINLMVKYGSVDYAALVARRFAAGALRRFEKAMQPVPDSVAKVALREAISFVVNRER